MKYFTITVFALLSTFSYNHAMNRSNSGQDGSRSVLGAIIRVVSSPRRTGSPTQASADAATSPSAAPAQPTSSDTCAAPAVRATTSNSDLAASASSTSASSRLSLGFDSPNPRERTGSQISFEGWNGGSRELETPIGSVDKQHPLMSGEEILQQRRRTSSKNQGEKK